MRDLTSKIIDLSEAGLSKTKIKKQHLLEAGAGTGKTYSIQTLYLRLILIEGLTVQQILVVTFTRDATKELRDRLQTITREALDYLDNPEILRASENRTKKIVDVALAEETEATVRQRLRLALLDFDMAAIFTIHGFCRRVLNKFAFETGQAFDVEPAGDSDDEIELLCKDWWRRNVYNMDERIAGFISGNAAFTLDAIAGLARKLIVKPDAILDAGDKTAEDFADMLAKRMNAFVKERPPTPEESADYPEAAEKIRSALKSLRRLLDEFRACVQSGQFNLALDALWNAAKFSQSVDTACADQAAALQLACEQFVAQVPKNTRADGFIFDQEDCLYHKRDQCPGLTPGHTVAVREAVGRLRLRSLVKQWQPFTPAVLSNRGTGKGEPRKEFGYCLLLTDHFCSGKRHDADRVYAAIKAIARSGCGIAGRVTCTLDAINPSVSMLFEELLADCRSAVLKAANDIKASYRQSRAAATTASFNDYLVDLRRSLDDNAKLPGILREQFRAALIDEFQDTDPIQWGVFEKLFKDAGTPCFLVGDPKQAIYRFRNGDVETYLKATSAVPDDLKHPLNKNYRSEKRLIDAVNQVFLDAEDRPTFGPGISYAEPLDAEGKNREESLLINGKQDETPFKIILIENRSTTARLPGKNSQSAKTAYALTAREIAGILNDPNQTIGGKRISKSDIAVLVRAHEEAGHIARELKHLNIPSVRQGTGNVWISDEGRVLWVMLEAVLDARNLSNVRNALLSPWCGLRPEDILELNEGKRIALPGVGQDRLYGLSDWVALFLDMRETWFKRGYPAMFRRLMATFNVKKRLLGHQDGQGRRRLANIGHLSELIERKISDDRKTPEGTLSWIRRQLDRSTTDGGEETRLRLETDDDAVRIMTVFTSKGLEFPIVFVPTLFMMTPRQFGGMYEYHDEDGNPHIAVKTGDKAEDDNNKRKERAEIDRENIRQIYVALTRAVHRTVLIALNDGSAAGKAKQGEEQRYKMRGILGEALRLPMKKLEARDAGQQRVVVDMEKASARFNNIKEVACAVDLRVYDDAQASVVLDSREPAGLTDTPPVRPVIDTSKGHGSFTSLAPRQAQSGIMAATLEYSEADARNRDGETAAFDGLEPAGKPEGIFAFPAGARTGSCWHEIFETLPFDATDDAIRSVAEETLRVHGFLKDEAAARDRIDVIVTMVKNVLQTELPDPGNAKGFEPFKLNTLKSEDVKTEWEFSFTSLTGKRTTDLKAAIGQFDRYRQFTDALAAWNREIPGGYLTGFVDLLFRKDGRYFIADWKSNRMNGLQADFKPERLATEIRAHCYWLQYLIYTVAVHQYLSSSVPAYCYDKHFGGIYYIFLRGVNGKTTDKRPNGVYADRPPESLVNELSAILGDFA